MSATASVAPAREAGAVGRRRLPRWWPLGAIVIAGAALRLSTLGLQSFWYDEAFTPVHVLHPSLFSTLSSMVHTENSPPVWYVLEWLDSRVLGTGEVALRLPSALAGIALLWALYAVGDELAGRRCAIAAAALAAVCPLFVWYSQEARVYALFALTSAVALLCFLRAERDPTPGRLAAFAGAGALALATHYFQAFMLIGMGLWLLRREPLRRRALPPLAAIGAVALALVPLLIAQGGHGTQWIGRWPLGERLAAIPQYYLLGTSGEPLGHGIELLVALPLLACAAFGLWRLADRPTASARGEVPAGGAGPGPGGPPGAGRSPDAPARTPEAAAALLTLIAACGVLIPIVLIAFGGDYLAPRNLIGAMVPVTALVAVLGTSPQAGRTGAGLLAAGVVASAAITIDVNLSPRLQRGDWRGVADGLRRSPAPRARAITTVELGAAPLEYYLRGLHNLHRGASVLVSEIDETGYAPLRRSAGEPPAPGFALLERADSDGLITYRFGSSVPRPVTESELRAHVITRAHPEVLVPAGDTVLR
ncbi:MAG TPA: glycosyltransferase family 39 protein [Solirubrobacteraceae bacterium]|nr:glycosyltransferase family 39 protein [Solirubrobacteraceae bacterium]